MRSKSRFMTLVLCENLENDIQNPCAIAVDASRPLSPEATKHLLPSGRSPYADPFSTGWIAPSLPGALVHYLKASCLVFVRLAHDRRFVGAVFFLLVLVLFVFIRISGRHRVAHDRKGAPVDPGGKFLGEVWGHVAAPGM